MRARSERDRTEDTMKINEELGRFESHYFTMVKLITNMLDTMEESRVRNIIEYAIEEAKEIKQQEGGK
jgi:GTPase involved in cell partitioning and DNA repair